MERRERRKPAAPRRRRGRPPSLDRERIVAAASRLGVSGLTMKRLGEELGVSDAALYHYFPSRAALVAAVVDAGVREAAFPADRGQSWREWLRDFARALRALLLAHPGAAGFGAQSGPTSPEQIALVAAAIDVLTRSGFARAEAAMAYSLVSSFVIASVESQERRAAARAAEDDIPARFARALERLPAARAEPLAEVAGTWLRATPDEHFEFGLAIVLDGLETRLSRQGS